MSNPSSLHGTDTQDAGIGKDIGSVAGGIIGSVLFPGVGTIIGSTAGGMLGGDIGSEFGPQTSSSTSSGGSSSVSNPFSGLFGGSSGGSSSSGPTSNAAETSGLQTNANYQTGLGTALENLGSQNYAQGQSIYGPGYSQFTAGASGGITPAQQALVTQNLGTMDTGTENTYGNLGLGGSTMESQDLASNNLRSLAEQSNISFQDESLGLNALQTADQYYNTGNQAYGTAESAFGGSSSSLNDAGNLAYGNLTELNKAISSLGNKSSSGLGGGISSLLGGATGTSGTGGALGSLFGGSGGTFNYGAGTGTPVSDVNAAGYAGNYGSSAINYVVDAGSFA